jgi:hypothetical protein
MVNISFAYTGDDPAYSPDYSCRIGQVTAQLGPDGSIKYNLTGNCGNNPITGQMAYSPSQHKMNERFYYGGADVTAMATCPADPWTSGAPCQDQKISAKGADPGPLLNFRVPLSLVVAGSGAVFQNARATASKPNPPGPPVNAKAVTHALPGTATVFWLGPDEHAPYGPYLDFIVEARPQNAQGAAWTRLGGLARHAAADYQLAVKLPAPVPGTAGWELRACSTTSLATTCTSPLIPTPDMTMLKQTPSTSFKGAIQTPPPSRNALTAPSSSFSTHPPVLRRGVEQETPGTEPKETAPEESQGEKQPVETTPGQ